MSDKNVNEDIKESARNIENSDEAAEVVIEMEKKIIKTNKRSILWVVYH